MIGCIEFFCYSCNVSLSNCILSQIEIFAQSNCTLLIMSTEHFEFSGSYQVCSNFKVYRHRFKMFPNEKFQMFIHCVAASPYCTAPIFLRIPLCINSRRAKPGIPGKYPLHYSRKERGSVRFVLHRQCAMNCAVSPVVYSMRKTMRENKNNKTTTT